MPPKYRFGERSLSLEGLPRTKSRGKEWGAREKAKREKGEKRKLLVWWQQRECVVSRDGLEALHL
jgi:hypothetical protein